MSFGCDVDGDKKNKRKKKNVFHSHQLPINQFLFDLLWCAHTRDERKSTTAISIDCHKNFITVFYHLSFSLCMADRQCPRSSAIILSDEQKSDGWNDKMTTTVIETESSASRLTLCCNRDLNHTECTHTHTHTDILCPRVDNASKWPTKRHFEYVKSQFSLDNGTGARNARQLTKNKLPIFDEAEAIEWTRETLKLC